VKSKEVNPQALSRKHSRTDVRRWSGVFVDLFCGRLERCDAIVTVGQCLASATSADRGCRTFRHGCFPAHNDSGANLSIGRLHPSRPSNQSR
jgi:hypothetical protein